MTFVPFRVLLELTTKGSLHETTNFPSPADVAGKLFSQAPDTRLRLQREFQKGDACPRGELNFSSLFVLKHQRSQIPKCTATLRNAKHF